MNNEKARKKKNSFQIIRFIKVIDPPPVPIISKLSFYDV